MKAVSVQHGAGLWQMNGLKGADWSCYRSQLLALCPIVTLVPKAGDQKHE